MDWFGPRKLTFSILSAMLLKRSTYSFQIIMLCLKKCTTQENANKTK